MKKFLFLLALPVILPFFAVAQFSISGKVSDKTSGEALPGAVISVSNTYIAVSSDIAGSFVIKNLKRGKYEIKLSFLGYKTIVQTIELSQNASLNFQMEVNPVLQDEVIISATRVDDRSPSTFENIKKNDIDKMNLAQDLPVLIDESPSVVTTSDAGAGVGYTGLRIRGSDITRINVTINGIPVNDAESQGVFWVNMPDLSSSVDNIQIQRGVGTSTNGSAAFGASINIQTLKLNPEPYAEISTSYGSFNTLKTTVMGGTGLIDGKWSFDGRLSRITSDGYIERAKSNLKSFYVSGAYYGKKSILKLIVFSGKEKTYQAWQGVPKDSLNTNRRYNPFTYENQTDNYQQDNYQLLYSYEFNKKWNLNAALHYTYGRGYYEEYKEGANYSSYGFGDVYLGNDTIKSTDLVRQKWLDNHFYGLTFSTKYTEKKFDITIGGAANKYDGDHYGQIIWAQVSNLPKDQRWYDNTGIKSDINIFAKANYLLAGKVNLYGDLQYRYVDYDIKGIDATLRDISQFHYFNFINPKAGVVYQINKMNRIYFSFAVANREPNGNNYSDADLTHQMPTNELLYDYELGYNLNYKILNLDFNIFYMDYRNQLILTGEINDVGYAIMTNIPKSYRAGIEISANINILKNLKLNINGAFSRNKIKDFIEYTDEYDADWNYLGQKLTPLGETGISFSPDIVAGGNLNYIPFKGFQVSLISKYVGKQYVDNTYSPDRMLNPYFVSNFLLSYTIKTKFIKEIEMSFLINNLFNKMYESNAWVYQYYQGGEHYTDNGYFPQAGINFLGGLTLKF
jgi:iron complex outermembrane receptor protein